jgi:hypothetical protein
MCTVEYIHWNETELSQRIYSGKKQSYSNTYIYTGMKQSKSCMYYVHRNETEQVLQPNSHFGLLCKGIIKRP